MRVLHVIPSTSPSSGGPHFALMSMARAIVAQGASVDIAATDDDGHGRRIQGIAHGHPIERDGFRMFLFPKQTEFYKVSLPLRRWLRSHARDYNVVHVNALFSFASTMGARAAHAAGVPYIIRPLGVLNQWSLKNRRRFVKKLSYRLSEHALLRDAAAIHCTSDDEAREVARLGFGGKTAVIPLGLDLSALENLPPPDAFHLRFPETRGMRNVLFLSRINPKKGLDLLLPAFARLHARHPDSRLIIAGDEGDVLPGYLDQLKTLAVTLGIARHITWTGFIEGDMRLSCFAAAALFVLPSYSENFGIALLEAMAAGVPCIASDQVALATDAARAGAVHLIPCDAEALATAMSDVLGDEAASRDLAKAGSRLAQERYSLAGMGGALMTLYHRITARAPAA